MKFSCLFVLILTIDLPVFTQTTDTSIHHFVGFQSQYGFIIPHSEKIEAVSGTNPAGFAMEYNRLNRSYKSWKVFNAFRISGFQAAYFSFRNPEILGSAFMITTFAEPILAHGSTYLFSVRAGAGLSYHTKLYDSIENPSNKFFSTRIAFPLYAGLRFNYRVSESTFFNLSAVYNHISNGGIRHPNIGMNFPTLAAGFQYFPSHIPFLHRDYSSDLKVKPGLSFIVQALWGYRVVDKTEIFPEKGAHVLGVHIRATKQLKTYYALNAGTELITDGAIKEIIRRNGTGTDNKRLALTAGHDFLFGNAVFTQYFGFYIYSPYKARNSVYQKYELAYKVQPDFSFGVYLKAHAHVAELMGLNVNYLFN